ncbi:AraC family transcriptional regulator [Nitrospirillum amazonense]|uniref:AraC family transcriptional regulator n=1 Tax=Nitrospirillum amazonense TaxID=28077 RepID=A0A560FGL8_9PROT|nr:helix-turn-helix domain-containing protein [Nitrospirillum amazonense]TWB20755.1 AraC family transcriptional regulator [Nitrospirillum amazonense]
MSSADATKSYVHLSTAGLPPGEAKAFWADEVSARRPGLLLDFPREAPFQAAVTAASLGPARLLALSVEPYVANRPGRYIARDLVDDFCLLYVDDGSVVVSDATGTDFPLSAGQFILLDDAAGFSLRFMSRTQAKALKMPRAWLSARMPCAEDLALTRIDPSTGWARALASVLKEVTPATMANLPLPLGEVAGQIAALLTLAAGRASGEMKRYQRMTFHRLRRAMREALHDPALTPSRFAEQQGIAKRTLHALFAAAGTSFGRELTAMRLDYARSLLCDARFSAKSITEISALAGFANPSHFSRRFLETFALSPSVYRRLHLD